MDYQQLIEKLWQQYAAEITQAKKIHDLFLQEGEQVVNDHIAFRTFDDPRVNIEVLAKSFLQKGYIEQESYDFPVKKLKAKYYKHPDDSAPKVFISQLLLAEFSPWVQEFSASCIDYIPKEILDNPEKLVYCGTPWQPIFYKNYEKLLSESQYAAWLYVYGFRANHFTVSVNHLKKYDTVEKVNALLKSHGFELNKENGEIKGTKQDMLVQSSTMAERKKVKFEDGTHEIPSCYYEFALRFPDKNGKMYQGFVAASADKIFESTYKK